MKRSSAYTQTHPHGERVVHRVAEMEASSATSEREPGFSWRRVRALFDAHRRAVWLVLGLVLATSILGSAIELSHDGKALNIQDGNGFAMDLSESLVALCDSDTPRNQPNLNEI